jgi:hypothetical protein
MSVICFDLDGVICTQTSGDYENAAPYPEAITVINHLFDEGHTILIFTARFMGRNQGNPIGAYKDGYAFTQRQLSEWGVNYHELHMGKPVYDCLVDDRGIFFDADWRRIYSTLSTLRHNNA